MCGEHELELGYSSSDDDTDSFDSFRSMKTERKARNWAYCILISYTVAAITFMAIFLIWFSASKKTESTNYESQINQ